MQTKQDAAPGRCRKHGKSVCPAPACPAFRAESLLNVPIFPEVDLSRFSALPAIRKAIYTTNAIESVNSVIRKFTRNLKQYPNEESALKLVYLAIHEASKKWTRPIPNWRGALNHFAIIFEARMPPPDGK